MSREFRMPSLGADMEAGTLVEWRVQPGTLVHRGDVVALVETEKGIIDIESFEEGLIERLLVQPDTRVPVGMPLALFEGAPAPAPAPPAGVAPPRAAPPAAAAPERVTRARVSPAARASRCAVRVSLRIRPSVHSAAPNA